MAEPMSPGGAPRPWWDLTPGRQNLVVLFLLFAITIPMLTKNFTSDFGTHIAIGRHIVQTKAIPDTEFLNYPSLGMKNFYGEWGFQAVLYGVYALGGVYGVSLLCWGIVFCVYLLLHRSNVLRGANVFVSVCAIFAFSGFLRIRIQPRPEIFTYLFIATTIYLFSEHFFGSRKKILFAFPVLMVFWANMHPSYLIGFVLSGAFIADRLARAIWNKEFRWRGLKQWLPVPLLAAGAGLLLSGLNPHVYGAILTPLHLISRGAGGATAGGGTSVLMSISELTPVKGTGFFVYYKAAAVFALASLCLGIAGRRIYLLDLFLFAIAFKGAWDSARAVSMMGLFLSPGISLHVTGFLGRLEGWFAPGRGKKKEPNREKGKRKGTPAGREAGKGARGYSSVSGSRIAVTAVTILALFAFGGATLAFSFSQLEYGIGITRHKFSFQAAKFLRENPIPGKMFNFFDIGGFLDWQVYPQALTFIDGRTYNKEVFMEHQTVTGALPGWEKVLEKYRVTYFVLKGMDSSGMILPIVPVLASDPNWALVFSDGLFLVFVRNTSEMRDYIRRHEVPKGVLPEHIIRESYHYMFLGVSPVVAYQTMSNMYLVMGKRDKAIQMLREVLEKVDDPYLRARMLQLEGGAGSR